MKLLSSATLALALLFTTITATRAAADACSASVFIYGVPGEWLQPGAVTLYPVGDFALSGAWVPAGSSGSFNKGPTIIELPCSGEAEPGHLTPQGGACLNGSLSSTTSGSGFSAYTLGGIESYRFAPKKPGVMTLTSTVEYDCRINDVTTPDLKLKTSYTLIVRPPGGGCGCPEKDDPGKSQHKMDSTLGSGNVSLGSVWFEVPLGPAKWGGSAGLFLLNSESPSTNLAYPTGLTLHARTASEGVDALYLGGGSPYASQVRVPTGLISNIVVNAYKYEVKAYQDSLVGAKTGQFYPVTGSPFVTWTVENPDGSTNNNRLWITEQRPGESNRVWKYTYTSTNKKWELLRPDENTLAVYWERVDDTYTNEVRTLTVGANVVQKHKKKWKYISAVNDVFLVEHVDGDDTVNETTTYTYNSSNWVERVDYPDGNWVYYKYDSVGRKTNEFRPFGLNSPPSAGVEPVVTTHLCKLIEYAYSLNSTDDGVVDAGTELQSMPRRIIEKVPVLVSGSYQAQEVSREYRKISTGVFETRRAKSIGQLWNSAERVSVYRYTDPVASGENLQSITFHDNTTETRSYVFTSTTETITVNRGFSDDPLAPNVLEGEQTITVKDTWGRVLSKTINRLEGTYPVAVIGGYTNTWYTTDPSGRDFQQIGMDGMTNKFEYACCGLDNVTEKTGAIDWHYYDVLKRHVTRIRTEGGATGIMYTNVLDTLGQILQVKRVGTNGSTIIQQQSEYDILGRIKSETNALGGVTTISHALNSGRKRITTTMPSGGTKVEDFYRDGRLEKTTGSAVFPISYEHGAEMVSDGSTPVPRLYLKVIKLDANYAATEEWTKTYFDMLGRPYKVVSSDATSSNGTDNPTALSFWNSLGQLEKRIDPDGVTSLYEYDSEGHLFRTVLDLDQDGLDVDQYSERDLSGPDRTTETTHAVSTAYDTTVVRKSTLQYLADAGSGSTLLSRIERAVDGLRVWQTTYTNASGGIISTQWTGVISNGYQYATNFAPDGKFTKFESRYGRLLTQSEFPSSGSALRQTSYSYDEHGRVSAQTDARNGVTVFTYNDADEIASIQTPPPGTGQGAQLTLNYFDRSGNITNIVYPDGTRVTNRFSAKGELTNNVGSRTYPVAYSYDPHGRMKTMVTWTNYPSLGEATTTWFYDEQGRLKEKRYQGESVGVEYTYTQGGRLKTRKWVRPRPTDSTRLLTTYSYGFESSTNTVKHGDLYQVAYNDGTTSTTIAYDRGGRKKHVISSALTTEYEYLWGTFLRKEGFTAGALSSLSITNEWDDFGRRSSVRVAGHGGTLNEYTYTTGGRFATIGDGTNVATYTYHGNSPLVSQIAFAKSGTKMTTTKTYDFLNRLQSISSVPSDVTQFPISSTYVYNDANERTRTQHGDDSYWRYEYDRLGQVTSGKRYWADSTPVAGQQYTYTFDDIGNRRATASGGDETGANLRSSAYTVNLLNQASTRTVPAQVEVLGLATNVSGSTVTVNGSSAYRYGEYFRKELTVTNSAMVFLPLTVLASSGGNSETNSGNVVIPPTPQAFTYDADGNLIDDSVWSYTWDAENRLIEIRPLTNNPAASKLWLTFSYDAEGKRIQKTVKSWTSNSGGGSWTTTSATCFAYDGWNVLGMFNSTNKALIQGYLWGLDLGDSLQGAGGVGGLIAIRDVAKGSHFASFDGNGNLDALVNASDGKISARYEYGPFGEMIRSSGVMAESNPFRFSNKWLDETGMLYYGRRYYAAGLGKWLSRDPNEERGGINLASFIRNTPINGVDPLGLEEYNSALQMFIWSLFGGTDGSLGPQRIDEVMNSSFVTIFADNLLLEGRSKWKCGSSGGFADFSYEGNFNPSVDMGTIWGIGWTLTGNWQLFLRGSCTWKCAPCLCDDGSCECYTRCRLTVTVSKVYTFVFVGGNPANIFTTPIVLDPFQSTYIISNTVVEPRLEIGAKRCR